MLDSGRGMLYSARKTLEGQWRSAEPYWQDTVKQQFDEQVLTPLLELSGAVLQAVDDTIAGDPLDVHAEAAAKERHWEP